MATKTTNYQCPACTGPLHFDSKTGKLTCDYCGSSYDVKEIEARYAAQQASADAANAVKLAAQGTAERTAELLRLEQLSEELQARSEEMQARLLKERAPIGRRRMIRAFPKMKFGTKHVPLKTLREQLKFEKKN